jgi:hypothetical protein
VLAHTLYATPPSTKVYKLLKLEYCSGAITMFEREENDLQTLEGICSHCHTKQNFVWEEHWENGTLYKDGTCPSCHEEHHIKVRSLRPREFMGKYSTLP